MSTIRFFTAALSVLASAASLVTAVPLARRNNTAVPYFSPKSFASTAWSGSAGHANSGLRVYFPTNGGIQELVAANGGLAAHDQKWAKGSFLSDPSFEVDDNAAIAAGNTYQYGQDEISVVFISKDMNLRSWEFSGGAWRKGNLVSSTPDFSGDISVRAYQTQNGPIRMSAFYTHGGGYLEELRRNPGAVWEYLGQVGKINSGVGFTSLILTNADNINKRIWTTDNQLYTWTTAQPTWTHDSGKTSFAGSSIEVAWLNSGNVHFFAGQGSPNASVTQWTMENGVFQNDPKVIAKIVQSTGTPVSVAHQSNNGKPWIYVFYLGTQSHLRCAMYDGTQWYVDDERVDV